MNKRVITYNQVIGFHSYPDAPPSCIYLSARHRHVFVIRCSKKLESTLQNEFGSPCEFGSYSCEDIAQWLLNRFSSMNEVEVLEDDFGGAAIQR